MRYTLPHVRSLFVAAIASSICAPALGWGPEGHQIIATIAAEHLNEQARAAVNELLRGRSMAEVANWADEVRSRPEYEWTRPLHYVNVPRDAVRVDMNRDCENGLCIIRAINDASQALRQRRGSANELAEALMFLIHFVGDIHQPMHVAYRDDLGGNQIDVIIFEDLSNLHRVWDSDLLRRRIEVGGAGHWRALATELQQGISAQQRRQWGGQIDSIAWANETLSQTRRIYAELPPVTDLGEAYYERNIPTVLERLSMAGVRLAALLNDIFPIPSEVPETPAEDDKPEEKEPIQPPEELQYVTLIFTGECGDEGRIAFLRNTHESKVIEVKLRKSWTDRGSPQSVEMTEVVRPGERNQRRLGCTHQRSGREVREFSWEIVHASFR
jgi:hypothetical protein